MASLTESGKALFGAYEKGVGLRGGFCACFECVCNRAADVAEKRLLWVDEGLACFTDEQTAVVLEAEGLKVYEIVYLLAQAS